MNSDQSHYHYHTRYGLDKDPFPRATPGPVYFLTPELKHRVELIKHLVEFSDKILLITAAGKCGKTSLYSYLLDNRQASWSVKSINAENELSINQLKKILTQDSSVKQAAVDIQPAGFTDYFESCTQDKKIPVMLVDNSHLLADDLLRFIIMLAGNNEIDPALRLVLFAEESINEKLNSARLKAVNQGIFHTIDIPVLTHEQTESYINYRLEECGYTDKALFSTNEIKRIHKVSAGVPGDINQLARQALGDLSILKIQPTRHALTKPAFQMVIAKPLLTIMAMVIIIMISAIVIRPETRSVYKTDQVVLPHEGKQVNKQGSSNTRRDDGLVKNNFPGFGQDVSAIKKSSSEGLAGSRDERIYQETSVKFADIENEVIKDKRQINTHSNYITGAGESLHILSAIKTNAWLGERNAEKYVLQLIGANQLTTLASYINATGIPTKDMAWFKTRQADKPWFVLVYGLYEDIESARAGAGLLPEQAKSLNPWPRKMGEIQVIME